MNAIIIGLIASWVITAVFFVKWKVTAMALFHFLETRGVSVSEREMKESILFVLRNILFTKGA